MLIAASLNVHGKVTSILTQQQLNGMKHQTVERGNAQFDRKKKGDFLVKLRV